MAMINISELKEGMVVAAPVVVQGNVMVPEGKTLTAKMLHILKAWGITAVDVVGDVKVADDDFGVDIPSAELDKMREAINYRLKGIKPEDEFMLEVKRIMMKRSVHEYINAQEQQNNAD